MGTPTVRIVFTPEERANLRSGLLERAANDHRIGAAAITGSVAAGREDDWSDIDLAFGVIDASETPLLLSDWTAHMYTEHGGLHHLDVRRGSWIYRVFLLANTLQVDLAFVEASEFRALTPAFELVFGNANEARYTPAPTFAELAGWGWLYALHARSSLARGKLWQTEYMVSGIRDQALALACIRHGLPAVYGHGIDRLPSATLSQLETSLVRHLDASELSRAFRAAVDGLLSEIRATDTQLAARLQDALTSLYTSA